MSEMHDFLHVKNAMMFLGVGTKMQVQNAGSE